MRTYVCLVKTCSAIRCGKSILPQPCAGTGKRPSGSLRNLARIIRGNRANLAGTLRARRGDLARFQRESSGNAASPHARPRSRVRALQGLLQALQRGAHGQQGDLAVIARSRGYVLGALRIGQPDPYRAHRLARLGASRTCDAGDGHRYVGPQVAPRAVVMARAVSALTAPCRSSVSRGTPRTPCFTSFT